MSLQRLWHGCGEWGWGDLGSTRGFGIVDGTGISRGHRMVGFEIAGGTTISEGDGGGFMGYWDFVLLVAQKL